MSRLRIAFGRISQETNSLSPVQTEVTDFRRTHWVEGAELLHRCSGRWRQEAPGMTYNAELSGFVQEAQRDPDVELIPLYSAWAIPGGPLSEAAFEELRGRLVDGLRAAGPLDGVMLSMHGAMGAVGQADPEAVLLRAVREAVPGVRVAITHDLHGHITGEKVSLTDAIVAYRTNPHRDHARCGRDAARIMLDTIRGKVRPTVAWRSMPMVLGGGLNIDFLAPMRGIYKHLTGLERSGQALTASIYQCHIWNDAPYAGWGVYVATDGDEARAHALADEICDRLWAVRDQLPPDIPDAKAAIAEARAARWARRFGVVCMSDASDMVGAGAPGENPALLAALLADATDMVTYACVRDAEVIAQLQGLEIGAAVDLAVGGKLIGHAPARVQGRLVERRDTATFGRAALIDAGHVKLVITEAAPLAMKPAFYTDWGLPLRSADIVVVKSLFPFRLYFLASNRKTIYARTTGTTDFDAFRGITYDRPVHPKDEVAHWRDGLRR